MNLKNKKKLIARMLNVGVGRIWLDSSKAAELKEAITRQDIKDLKQEGIIKVKDKKGRATKEKRKTKKRAGKKRKRIGQRKQNYIKLTRKLRKHVKAQKDRGKLGKKEYKGLRKKIKAGGFKDLGHLREAMKE